MLLLLLWLAVGTVALPMLRPADKHRLVSSYNSTSVPIRLDSYSLTSVLCDSQQTTTMPGVTVSTVGIPCEPTDVAANQTQYLAVVIASLILFALFFLLGFRLWT